MNARTGLCAIALLVLPGCITIAQTLPGEIVCDTDGATMKLIPAGGFTMGSEERTNQIPSHQVQLDAFYLDVNEVTHAQWKQFVVANPDWSKDRIDPALHDGKYLNHWDGDTYDERWDDYPIIFVSWHAASAYAKWAGKRLPTEAEWERAARGPEGWRFPYGDEYDETKANTGYARGGPISVGSFDLDSFGIADLSGNVMEWCADWYSEDYYAASPAENPQGPETGTSHVARGGSWGYVGDRVGAAFRYHMTLPLGDGSCNDRLGFRCAMDVPEAQ